MCIVLDYVCGAGYPPEQAVEVALRTVREYLEQNHEKVCVCVCHFPVGVLFLPLLLLFDEEHAVANRWWLHRDLLF